MRFVFVRNKLHLTDGRPSLGSVTRLLRKVFPVRPLHDRDLPVGFASAVVHELQGKVELLALEQVDDLLEVILLLGRDA